MKKTKKDTTINLRLPYETKELLTASAKSHGKTSSAYLRFLIERDASAEIANQNTHQKISHEQMVTNSLSENQFINGLLINTEISNKSKKVIGRELRKHV